MRVGFLGLGRMGLPMVSHIRAGGYDVLGYDTDEAAGRRAWESEVSVADTPAAFADRDIVCSSLPDTAAVEQAYAGPGGIFDVMEPGTVCVDLSTISVGGSRAFAEAGRERGIGFIDAPVSGTSTHAAAGTLAVMVGGAAADLERARPVLECFSASVDHVGPNGAGLLLKLATNRLLTVHLAAIAEAVVEMEAAGLDVAQGLDILRRGAVPKLLDYKAAPLADRDFTPLFTVDLMRKDLRLAGEVLPGFRLATLAREILEEAAERGHGADDVAALITSIEAELPGTGGA